MENNDSNTKSQQTGGLKLMTVFIAVLALHVVVIGGFTVYHLMSGGSADADLVTVDKSKKDAKSIDATTTANTSTTDASQSDKTSPATPTPATSTEVATAPAVTPTPDATSASEIVPPTPGRAPTLTPTPVAPPYVTSQPPPLSLVPPDIANASKLEPLAPLTSNLAPMPPPTSLGPDTSLTPPPLNSSLASGPVHMPPAAKAPSPTHVDGQSYTVKITDSYKKIASAHHITVAQLKAVNHIKGDTLHAGEKLIIPPSKSLVATATPSSTTEVKPVTSSLIENTSSSTAALAAAPVYTGTAVSATSHDHTYTVVKGDTLGKIAHKFKTTPSAIMTENNITDPTKLTIGKKLKIPSKESRSAGNSVPVVTPVSQPQVQPSIQPQPQPQVEAKSDAASAQLANYKESSDTNF